MTTRLDQQMVFRVSARQRRTWRVTAAREGVTPAEWMRRTLDHAAALAVATDPGPDTTHTTGPSHER